MSYPTVDILANSHDPVRRMTPASVNRKLDLRTKRLVRGNLVEGPEAVRERLAELDREWNIDRILMVNFAVVTFVQLLAARRRRKWLWGPLIQTPLLLLHAPAGWCPPTLLFRPLGFRTQKEIQAEREALLEGLQEDQTQLRRNAELF